MSAERPKARVVFDCMVFLQGAARRESPAAACLLLTELGVVELCVSGEILSEIRDVLTRPSIQRRFPALTDAVVDRFLSALSKHSLLISPVPRPFSRCAPLSQSRVISGRAFVHSDTATM